MNKFYNYNKSLKQNSKQLRSNSTLAEIVLWNEVLKARKTGFQFHRQRPILNYIADFFCKELKLIIETDGATHLENNVKIKDEIKQSDLIEHGYNVLRFEDIEVVGDTENVKERINLWINEYEIKHPEVLTKKVRNKRS